MIMSIQKYSINLVYCPGKQLVIADTLSRAYLPDQSDSHTSLEFEVNVVSTLPISKPKLNQLQSMTQCDPDLQQLVQITQKGWPDRKSKVPTQCLPYWSFREQISFSDGILFKGEKIIIPKAMQSEMLKLIHRSGHSKKSKPSNRHFVLARNGISNSRHCFILCNLQRTSKKKPKGTFDATFRPR